MSRRKHYTAALDVQGLPDTELSCAEWQGVGKSDVPDPDLLVEEDNTCESLNALASTLSPDLCVRMEATAGVYCGCDNPVASEGYCRICGGDTLLPDTSIIGEPVEEESCGSLEANFDGLGCEELQEKYFDECCPGITKETDAPVECSAFLERSLNR